MNDTYPKIKARRHVAVFDCSSKSDGGHNECLSLWERYSDVPMPALFQDFFLISYVQIRLSLSQNRFNSNKMSLNLGDEVLSFIN